MTPVGESAGPEADERPQGETREGGPAGPEAEPESPGDGAAQAEACGSVSRRWRSRGGRLRGAAAAGMVAVLLGGGGGFLYGAHQLRSTEAARNRALTDTEATARVAGEIDNALARVFSYTPDGTATAERSARTVLDGRAARQYQELFARVRDDLAGQRITLSTKAVRTGVIELDGDRARLLVFLDQTSRRGDGKATTAAAQLTVMARLVDDRWRIVDIKAR
ncbi:hypothetical protein QWJ26_31170 [Streptomyces sp. CSDS2]|uniref:hypothetical protein n=1 Tax=Streptomyces sp. CSDS2 TaxID=3055051 RepID=UPI0025B25C3E|nr:hypothetical protein [Streptomyces sp. CSDS2]MDN3264196.1 hypothetical protein [Streptomyces sp. CSDS2]